MERVYSVTQINTYVKNMFTYDALLQSVSVKGEVSNCTYHRSNHIYFTLKDGKSTISCVMFAGNRRGLNFEMTEGMKVVVKGNVDVFERDGKYQLYAKSITKEGIGELYEQYEALKKMLEERGMFDACYKQPIPKYIKTLGVVTAPTGAAVQDIINITRRRNPYVQIILYPAIVQGEQAAPSIVRGIKALEKQNVDVMIVGRGGGSLEDLWAFNEEIVAQAIFDCSIPIISAVGHETDTTIADYVADLRAPTPSAGAELAVYEVQRLYEQLEDCEQKMAGLCIRKCNELKTRTSYLQNRLGYLSPMHQLRTKRNLAAQLEEKLLQEMNRNLMVKRHKLQVQIERMKGLSPLEKLNQGFSFTENENGKPITDVHSIKKGDVLTTYVKNGKITSTVDGVEERFGILNEPK